MFPLKDDNPTEITPVVTMLLIATCVGVWVFVQGAGLELSRLMASVCSLGAIPGELTGQASTGTVDLGGGLRCTLGGRTWSALFTSMFLHGSWMHLIGNMWFLWIFGNNIEDSMGHIRFLVFYVVTGVLASTAHVVSDPGSPVPMVGASGAISGIMGAYLILYPRARVRTLLIIVILIKIVDLPAFVMLGYWFLIQLFSSMADQMPGQGGIAFWAHIGGFAAGAILVKLFASRRLVEAKRAGVVLPRDEIPGGGWL
jgi:membrane associated rhomboid family serine protease